jgi:hypothetical protein
MTLSAGPYTFEWIEGWGTLPAPSPGSDGRTHGVAVTADGRVVVFRQGTPAVLFLAEDGQVLDAWGDFPGAHGLTLVEEDGEECLWLTDETTGEVVKTTLHGEPLLRLDRPDHPAFKASPYAPTWVAVHERRHGGTGDVWVADGYGASLVHHYREDGTYVGTLTGEEGAGAFDCPHAVWVELRGAEPELFVADRGNRRLQALGLRTGAWRTVEGGLHLPCVGLPYGEGMLVPELSARLTFLSAEGKPLGYLGANETVCGLPGWPDLNGELVRAGRFNSPHSATADARGTVYVVEWIRGGRLTKLRRL